MPVTASKIGSSPLTLDWTNLAQFPAGTGPGARPSEPDQTLLEETWSKLKERLHPDDVGFFLAPAENDLSQAKESIELAKAMKKGNQFKDCLFLGIGGSALGPLSLLAALQDRGDGGIRFHFMENVDPIEWKSTIRKLLPETTLVAIVTKSGTTFETMAQALIALEWLGRDRWKTQVVAITDPVKGDLKTFATQEGIPTLHIAPAMGGRFSIFTPVGLFPAALAGLDVEQFLLGARQVRDHVEKAPVTKNPIFILAQELIRHAIKRPTHVCMPYSTRLSAIGDWFVQLWGESLGKDGKGFTPIAAVGATDQHSILQLLRDGPDDKITIFITIDQVDDGVKIPKAQMQPGQKPLAAFKILEGHSLKDLLSFEYRATSLVLTKQGRPNITITLDRLDERTLGALYFTFAVLTAFTGTMWNVNPFDQPGVEEGKVYIRESLSQATRSQRQADEDDSNSPVARLRRELT